MSRPLSDDGLPRRGDSCLHDGSTRLAFSDIDSHSCQSTSTSSLSIVFVLIMLNSQHSVSKSMPMSTINLCTAAKTLINFTVSDPIYLMRSWNEPLGEYAPQVENSRLLSSVGTLEKCTTAVHHWLLHNGL